jgi:hypothetical protein
LFHDVAQQFVKTLGNLDTILDKAMKYAEARGYPVDNFMTARLAPDMLPFTRQVQIACDAAKAATAAMAGQEAPRYPDEEKTMAELRERIAKTLEYLRGFSAADFEKTPPTALFRLANPAGKAMHLHDAVLTRSVPNFFFHVAMAYALLRQGGVDIGKRDYLGQLALVDA